MSDSSTDPKATAAAWRECLAPQQPENSLGPHVGSNSISDYFVIARSPERKRLAGKVVDSVTNIFNDLVADPTWKGMFDKDPRGLKHVTVQAQLVRPAREIRKQFCKEGRPVIIAFDEAAPRSPRTQGPFRPHQYRFLVARRPVLCADARCADV